MPQARDYLNLAGLAIALVSAVALLPTEAAGAPASVADHARRPPAGRHLQLAGPAAAGLSVPDTGMVPGLTGQMPRRFENSIAVTTRAEHSDASSGDTTRLRTFHPRWNSAPDLIRQVRDFKRHGLPIVHLWQSTHALLAIGLNRRGVPGIYITQRIPND